MSWRVVASERRSVCEQRFLGGGVNFLSFPSSIGRFSIGYQHGRLCIGDVEGYVLPFFSLSQICLCEVY